MNIKFYTSTRKFVNSHRYINKKFYGPGRCGRSMYKTTMQRAKSWYGSFNHKTKIIKINLSFIFSNNPKCDAVNKLMATVFHESLHHVFNDDVDDEIEAHGVIYKLEHDFFPGTLSNSVLKWYNI